MIQPDIFSDEWQACLDKINAARLERRISIYRQICGDEEVDNPPVSEACLDKVDAAERDGQISL